MKEILSVENMRQSDAHTIATEVPSLELMYRAGKAVADSVEWRAPVGIVCGVGNNAGDGYVIALELKKRGIEWQRACKLIFRRMEETLSTHLTRQAMPLINLKKLFPNSAIRSRIFLFTKKIIHLKHYKS